MAEARSRVGSKLDELGGRSVGRIDGLLVDVVDGSPTWLLVRLGRFGRHAAVPFDFVALAAGRAWAPFSRETIRAAAQIDPAAGLSCAKELELSERYAIPEETGRPAVLADRGAEDPGSAPASA